MSGPFRPSWVEIDLGAITHNVRLTRELIGPEVKLFAVCKANAMGCGLVPVARTMAEAGADAFAVSDPDDVTTLRSAGLTLPIFLFASTLPEQAREVAELGAIVAVHNFPSLEAYAALERPVEAFIKIDCGLGRLGFTERQWRDAFELARSSPMVRVKGLYTHMSNPEDPEITREQAARFDRAYADATEMGFSDLDKLGASSRSVLGYPEYHYTAVDPGRLLLGMLSPPWVDMAPMRPAVSALKSRIMQVQTHPAGAALGIGYGQPIASDRSLRTAVAPIGFHDGLNHAPPLGEVLICGRRAPVLGRRSIEHSLIDVSEVPEAEVGSEVVLLGRQGAEEITGQELADSLGLPLLDLLPRIARNARRVYIE